MYEDFADFVASQRPRMVRTTVLLGCPEADAEDVVQTALARCLRGWPSVCNAENRDAYVNRVLINALNNARARKWNGELPTEVLPDRTTAPPALADGLVVRRALAAMSTEHREVLVLRFFADLSERQTADVLALPRGTVKSRTARALAALSAHQDIVTLTSERGA